MSFLSCKNGPSGGTSDYIYIGGIFYVSGTGVWQYGVDANKTVYLTSTSQSTLTLNNGITITQTSNQDGGIYITSPFACNVIAEDASGNTPVEKQILANTQTHVHLKYRRGVFVIY